MSKQGKYEGFEALDPFFAIIQNGLTGLVDGEHFFDTFAEDAIFESRYDFPGWPRTIRGRAALVDRFSGYGDNIKLHSSGGLIVHRSQDRRVVILEYEVHGKIVATGAPYDNRFISVLTVENKKIVHWRDYMDSLAARRALNGPSLARIGKTARPGDARKAKTTRPGKGPKANVERETRPKDVIGFVLALPLDPTSVEVSRLAQEFGITGPVDVKTYTATDDNIHFDLIEGDPGYRVTRYPKDMQGCIGRLANHLIDRLGRSSLARGELLDAQAGTRGEKRTGPN